MTRPCFYHFVGLGFPVVAGVLIAIMNMGPCGTCGAVVRPLASGGRLR